MLPMWETPKVAQLYTLYCRRQRLPSPLLPLSVFPFPSCRPTLRASVAAFQASLVHRAFARSGGAATAKGPMCNLFTLQIHSHHKQRSHRARRCVEELSRCSYNITISHLKGQSMYRQKKTPTKNHSIYYLVHFWHRIPGKVEDIAAIEVIYTVF